MGIKIIGFSLIRIYPVLIYNTLSYFREYQCLEYDFAHIIEHGFFNVYRVAWLLHICMSDELRVVTLLSL